VHAAAITQRRLDKGASRFNAAPAHAWDAFAWGGLAASSESARSRPVYLVAIVLDPVLVAIAGVVIAVAVGIEHQRHQPASDQDQDHDTENQGDKPRRRHRRTVDHKPGPRREPNRRDKEAQQHDDPRRGSDPAADFAHGLAATAVRLPGKWGQEAAY